MIYTSKDINYMQIALDLAKLGLGFVEPNPLVGAVIVKDDRLIAKGYHKGFGLEHAEVNAINSAKEELKGSTLYVTLEPCNHHGKTPPCVDKIIAVGIKTVYIACLDQNKKASGGIKRLEDAGIKCYVGLLEKEALELNHLFFDSLKNKRPTISLKMATTLNGYIARADYTSKYISSKEARAYVHRLRGAHAAILVGVNTANIDNPLLDARDFELKRSPIPVLLDRQGNLKLDLKLLQNKNTIIYTTKLGEKLIEAKAKHKILAQVVVNGLGLESFNELWQFMLADLYLRNIQSLFVEGGQEVATFLVNNSLVDWFYLFLGPTFFLDGSIKALSLEKEVLFQKANHLVFGDTIMLEGRLFCSQV